MKVTVCFGDLRILVPCGRGELLVRDLIIESTRRYKKAAGKEADSWVAVHHLQTQSGILDPDDWVRDVADDREQILAHFEDSGPDPGVLQGGGDGASGSSSVGTGSPDIFRDPTNTEAPTRDLSTPHIEVTSTSSGPLAGLGVGLMVRRSSDPNLLASLKSEGGNKRWSAAAPHYDGGYSAERLLAEKASGHLLPHWEEEDDRAAHLQKHLQQQQPLNAIGATFSHQPFARSGRLSMQFLGDRNGYKWIDAAEKLQHQQPPQIQVPTSLSYSAYLSKSLPRESKRKEPLGQAYESIREKDGEILLITNEIGSPLGLTAIPDKEHAGGLIVQHVEPGSRAERGRLRCEDRILEINGLKLIGLRESLVQDQLRRALESSELRVRVMRGDQHRHQQQQGFDSKIGEMVEVATVSSIRKPNAAPVGTSLQVANTRKLGCKIEILLKKGPNGLGFSVTTRDNPAGGHCPIYIKNILPCGAAIEDGRLKPGDRLLEVDGTPMTGKNQTDVVAILRGMPSGATVRIVVSRQQELVELPIGSPSPDPPEKVAPVVLAPVPVPVQKWGSARSLFQQQQHIQQNTHLNESQHFIDAGSESAASNDSIPQSSSSWHSRDELTLHIPVHDTEKAGLGVSVKGKTCSNLNALTPSASSIVKHDGDLGIFVKNVIHGGAASRDGRLRMNDQLLSVNGVSLRGQKNAEAMETLRRAMVNNPGKHPGTISLLVGRKVVRSASSNDILQHSHSHCNGNINIKSNNESYNDSSSESSSNSNSNSNNSSNGNINSRSNASDTSGTTVIYLSPEKREYPGSGYGLVGTGSDMNRWSNPVLDRLTGGICSTNLTQPTQQQETQHQQSQAQQQRVPPPLLSCGQSAPLRNESYYMATNDNWSPAPQQLLNGHGNTALLIEDDAGPNSPTLSVRALDRQHFDASCAKKSLNGMKHGGVGAGATTPAVVNFDATYSSQLSLETNNSGVEHFSRDALGRRSISEKHHAVLDARETGTYQRNKKLREERERERRIHLTKSAVYGGSIESLTSRIASANVQMVAAPESYKHAKTNSHIDKRALQQELLQSAADAEARDQLCDLGPSLGLKKSSSLESLQTMVQELQMSDKKRGHQALRAPRGRGREDSLRAAVVSEPNANKPRKTWLLEEADHEGGFASQRNGPFQSSLNDGKHCSKLRAKKPSILRGIGHMFRFGKNRKDGVVPVDSNAMSSIVSSAPPASLQLQQQQNPAAALAAMERNVKPPAYQPPPPLPKLIASGGGYAAGASGSAVPPTGSSGASGSALNVGINQNDIFNHRYQHYANHEDLHQLQISRRHQHYHSQRSTRSQDISMHATSLNQQHPPLPVATTAASVVHQQSHGIRPMSSYHEYDAVQQQQQQRVKHSHSHSHGPGHQNCSSSSPSIVTTMAQPHWKATTIRGYSPESLNSSAHSRGPFVTQVTIREQSGTQQLQSQPQQHTNQSLQKITTAQSQSQYSRTAGAQPHASKV